MVCMKCGREAPEGQSFCQDCLLEMEKYPVKPGTVVLLPKRRETASPKKPPRRRTVSPEEQLRILKKRVRVLTALLVLLLAMLASLVYPAARYLMSLQRRPGQNYSSIVVTTAPAEHTQE